MILFLYKDEATASDIQITSTSKGIEFYCYSIFDRNTWESDTYVSKPFSPSSFKKLLEDLKASGKGIIDENDQTISVEKSGTSCYKIDFDRGVGNRCTIHDVALDVDELCAKINNAQAIC